MKFNTFTFFEKYNIEPNIPFPKLMVLFQTDPSKRKDLPIVISTIKNQEKLFEEQLFTIDKEKKVDNRSKLLIITRELTTSKKYSEFLKTFLSFLNEEKECYSLFYAANIPKDKLERIVKDFKDSIYDEFLREISDNFDIINSHELSSIMKNIEKLPSTYSSKFEEKIAEKMEFFFSKIEDKSYLEENLKFVFSLPPTFIRKKQIYSSFVYFIKK